jgi:hypothetical protein
MKPSEKTKLGLENNNSRPTAPRYVFGYDEDIYGLDDQGGATSKPLSPPVSSIVTDSEMNPPSSSISAKRLNSCKPAMSASSTEDSEGTHGELEIAPLENSNTVELNGTSAKKSGINYASASTKPTYPNVGNRGLGIIVESLNEDVDISVQNPAHLMQLMETSARTADNNAVEGSTASEDDEDVVHRRSIGVVKGKLLRDEVYEMDSMGRQDEDHESLTDPNQLVLILQQKVGKQLFNAYSISHTSHVEFRSVNLNESYPSETVK